MKFLADENFNRRIVRGLLLQIPALDIVIAQNSPVAGKDDPTVLEFAAQYNRIVLTHDENTMIGFANDRMRAGLEMLGLIFVDSNWAVGFVVKELVLGIQCGFPEDFENRVKYLPLD